MQSWNATRPEEAKNAGTVIWVGIFLLIAGVLALAAPLFAGISVTLIVGMLMIFGGVSHSLLVEILMPIQKEQIK